MLAKKPLILFDIDRTMIDTDLLRILQKQTLAKTLNCSEDEIVACFQEYYGTLEETSGFRPKDFLTFLSQRFQVPLENLMDVFFEPKKFQQILYPEVIEVLSKLRSQQYTLGIYSQGDKEFQEHKLLANNLMTYFNPKHQYIRDNKMDPEIIENLPENTIIIDDKPEIISFLETWPQIIPLHMVRNSDTLYGEFTISSLNDLFPILDSLRHS